MIFMGANLLLRSLEGVGAENVNLLGPDSISKVLIFRTLQNTNLWQYLFNA
jgi:hypothetical protein